MKMTLHILSDRSRLSQQMGKPNEDMMMSWWKGYEWFWSAVR